MTLPDNTALRELLDTLGDVTLEPGTVTASPFDDNPDRRDVELPVVRIHGDPGWGDISAPKYLTDLLALAPELAAEVIRLRTAVEDTLQMYVDAAERTRRLSLEHRDHGDPEIGTAFHYDSIHYAGFANSLDHIIHPKKAGNQ